MLNNQVEAVLEDFEKRNANNEDKSAVEAQRRYLGGDSDHSILVKGLDIALLEQNKTRAAGLSAEDDDILEQAFQDITSQATVPKKRTRDDLIRELKEKRAQKGEVGDAPATTTAEEETLLLEEAKKKGKFKPIGYKPPEDARKKKKGKVNVNGGERKKKRKVAEDGMVKDTPEHGTAPRAVVSALTGVESSTAPTPTLPEPEPEPVDFDIFADAGEYKGIDLGDDEEEEEEDGVGVGEEAPKQRDYLFEEKEGRSSEVIPRRWIETDGLESTSHKQELLHSILERHPSPLHQSEKEETEEDGQLMRLMPLASSALPSIKDFLAMDSAAGGRAKRNKRKSGKKEGRKDNGDSKKRDAEVKADRDYKRSVLRSFLRPPDLLLFSVD